jgi:long-subunit acyl-CoA synthetase (AMP-forming)
VLPEHAGLATALNYENVTKHDVHLSYLPLAHMFGKKI